MSLLISPHIERLIELALDEDDLNFDVTSTAFFAGRDASATLLAKQDLVVSGLPVATAVFERVDHTIDIELAAQDGDHLSDGALFATLEGDARSLLQAERTALNFLQRMSGVATKTSRYVEALGESTARITDTRKTLPGWRELDKYAVSCGGGANHRYSLAGGIIIKDNHIIAAGGVEDAVKTVRATAPHTLKIEVEVETLDMLDDALDAGADIVMLDNMTTETMRRAVQRVRDARGHDVLIEASGNITVERLPELADVGLDFISSGALTHSAIAADISMNFEIRH